ncbi:hypothetical protein KCU81_g634, partial [Aureobasidium melanogenum]
MRSALNTERSTLMAGFLLELAQNVEKALKQFRVSLRMRTLDQFQHKNLLVLLRLEAGGLSSICAMLGTDSNKDERTSIGRPIDRQEQDQEGTQRQMSVRLVSCFRSISQSHKITACPDSRQESQELIQILVLLKQDQENTSKSVEGRNIGEKASSSWSAWAVAGPSIISVSASTDGNASISFGASEILAAWKVTGKELRRCDQAFPEKQQLPMSFLRKSRNVRGDSVLNQIKCLWARSLCVVLSADQVYELLEQVLSKALL